LLPQVPQALEIGKGRIVREGKKVAILSLGTRLEEAEKAADQLEAKGLSTTVADLRFAKPLDEELIRKLLTTHEVAVTIEEASIGGLGAHVLTLASDEGLTDAGLKIRTMRLPDRFIDQDKPEKQYDEARPQRAAHRRNGAEGAAQQQRRHRGGPGVARIRADQLLVSRGLAESRTRAQALIMAGAVFSGEKKLAKAGDMLGEDARWRFAARTIPGCRAAGSSSTTGSTISASTSPARSRSMSEARPAASPTFCSAAARRKSMRSMSAPTSSPGSFARTRGSSSLNRPTLASDRRDRSPIRSTSLLATQASYRLSKVLESPLKLARSGAHLVALVKPQFEAGREEVGKGGVVRDPQVHERVCANAAEWVESQGWDVLGDRAKPDHRARGQCGILVGSEKAWLSRFGEAWWRYALITVPAIVLLGSLSGWISNSGYGNEWFDALDKPFFMPPGWAFGVVWPILYACWGSRWR
jgi:hypothetical protein